MNWNMRSMGIVFLSRTKPEELTTDGKYSLTLRVVDRAARFKTAAWNLHWYGDEAKAWYAMHREALVAGTPLEVECLEACSHTIGNSYLSEIHAKVTHCKLAPRAGSHQPTNDPAACQPTADAPAH